MLLTSATMSGFKSFRKRTKLPISDRTTILIGPNDHGKTNALFAIDRLNAEKPFGSSEINDRFEGDPAYIGYTFKINEHDVQDLFDALKPALTSKTAQVTDSGDTIEGVFSGSGGFEMQSWRSSLLSNGHIEVTRQPDKPLQVKLDDVPQEFREPVSAALLKMIPKVILFTPEALRQLPDTVTLPALETNEVMQGVFRLAGIWEQRQLLLSGNTRKNKNILRDAEATLTKKIRQNWTQGQDLEFYLEYVGSDIRLTVKDSAKIVTAVGDRSEGFTAYFAMRMLLIARTDAAQPNGYVFMFDEPGLNLHPKGQVDLQNVFEDISRSNQIIYSTHSVFLINKNYPDRNHLIFKNEEGSNIDNKPFVGGWAKVKEHLGLYLSSNFLFSDKVLLAEGATDEIYVPLILQGLIEHSKFDGDLNAFAIHSALNEAEMIGSASIYSREGRHVAILVDGDDEGNRRKQRIEAWATRAGRNCPVINLGEFKAADHCSIEDFLEPATFREAVASACKEAIEAGVLDVPNATTWESDLKTQLRSKEGKSLGKRVEEVVSSLCGRPISDVWIARRYSELLRAENPVADANLQSYWQDEVIQRLARRIWTALELPTRGDIAGIPFTSGQ